MKGKNKKIFLLSLLGLLCGYSLWLSFHLIRFNTYKIPPDKTFPREIEGSFHIHSSFSDGRKHTDKIAGIASSVSLDFIIITDHGNPNYDSLAYQGWKHGILVLAGSELSVNRGHFVALNFKTPEKSFSGNGEMSLYQIKTSKGFSVIAHPYSKGGWSWSESVNFSGIELINADSMLRQDIFRYAFFLPGFIIKPDFILLKALTKPGKNLRKWDTLNRNNKIFGYYAVDAHLFYRQALSLLRLHLLLDRPLSREFETAKGQVYKTLKQGAFYNAIDAAAEAKGFRFWCDFNGKKIPMGGGVLPEGPVTFFVEVPFPFKKEVFILHNGNTVHQSKKNMISFQAIKPGAYRVEVYLRERSPLGKKVPWILSNPIFLKGKKQ